MSERAGKDVRYTLPLSAVDATEPVAFNHPKGNKTVYVNTIADFLATGNQQMKVIIPPGATGGTVYSGLKRAAKKKADQVRVNAHKRKEKDSIILTRLESESEPAEEPELASEPEIESEPEVTQESEPEAEE